jgi:benzoyl-CoA reductase/2-hydroxyglutaryl-CoA dehydratase subunit BcrC/BadD/HgdB
VSPVEPPRRLTLEQWEDRHAQLRAAGLREPWYGGPLGRHAEDGDLRLPRLLYDDSAAALRLWNLLLTEERRLFEARERGWTIVGTMKDLGTVPILAYALPKTLAFYPDGAWWIPCVMELSAGLLEEADRLGVDESFCPVRAMLGAFVTGAHFPRPDLVTCSVGATCDDFSAIAQRLQGLGVPVFWWEIPARREPEPGEEAVTLPGGGRAPASQLRAVRGELDRIAKALTELSGERLTEARLREGVRAANRVRRLLEELRLLVFTAPRCPLPALELLIAEMLAIHYCSDRDETIAVLEDLVAEVRRRVEAGVGHEPHDGVRVFWVNPVADLRVMNLLEAAGGRLGGTELLFLHALDEIDEDGDPLEALARAALADPMIGTAEARADRVVDEARRFGSEAVLVSRIPGASHCAREGEVIARRVEEKLGLPTVEIEVPPVSDALAPTISTRLEALMEAARARRPREEVRT